MDGWILKVLLLFVFSAELTLEVSGGRFCNNPTPPLCADDCNGNGYYLNEEQTECIQCPTCPAGQELNKACGNGLNGDAICRPCPDGYFSTSTSRHCSPCTRCINTIEVGPCQVTQDRVCGDCLPGFVRSSDRFSANPDACPERCADLPRDVPECRDWWSEQAGEPIETRAPPPPVEQPVPVEPLDGPYACEPQPPRCIDPCFNGNYYVGSDGLCKACLQCQPGEELNKVCGRGKNGNAYCQPCPEGTFSEDGLGRCTPCRICVNTEATECTSIRDTVCGECLPGYYQEADGFFPDREACPNKCMECPTTIPQCQEWCESKKHMEEVSTSSAQPTRQDTISHQDREELGNNDTGKSAALSQAVAGFQNDAGKEEINDEAGSIQAHHVSYTTIFIVLASLLAVVIIILIIVLVVFRHSWNITNKSNASNTESPLLSRSGSGTPSPESYRSSTVYMPTTYEPVTSEDQWGLKHYIGGGIFSSLTRPISGTSEDSENRSSAVSTPTMNLNRNLANRNIMEGQRSGRTSDAIRSMLQHQSHNRHMPYLDFEEGITAKNLDTNIRKDGPWQPPQSLAIKPSERERILNGRSGYLSGKNEPCSLSSSQGNKDEASGSQVRRRSSGRVFIENNLEIVHPPEDHEGSPVSQVRRRSSGKVFIENNVGMVHPQEENQDGPLGSQVRRRSSGKVFIENNLEMVHPREENQDGPLGSQARRRSSGSRTIYQPAEVNNHNTLSEQEPVAELYPTDSSNDTGHSPDIKVDTKNNNTDVVKHQDQPSTPSTSSCTTATDSVATKPRGSRCSSLDILHENSTTETNPEKTPSKMLRNTVEPSFTVNINLNTKDVEKLHVGNVHVSSHTYPKPVTHASDNGDEDDEADEGERLLDMIPSESDGISRSNDNDEDYDEKDELLNPMSP